LKGRSKGGFGPDSYYVNVQPRPIVKIKARTRWKGVMGKARKRVTTTRASLVVCLFVASRRGRRGVMEEGEVVVVMESEEESTGITAILVLLGRC